MANGKRGDNPFTDMLWYGAHPFPRDVEAMLRKLHEINPGLINDLEWAVFDWAEGRDLEDGRVRLRALLAKHGVDPATLGGAT